MHPAKHVERLLAQSDRYPAGALRRALIDEAISIADATDDQPTAYAARLRLAASAALTGDSAARLAAFEWCLERHLADSIRFPAIVGEVSLLAEFLTIPLALASSPRFSAQTIEQSLGELHELYSANRCPESGSLFARLLVARAMGESAQASSLRAQLTRAERSERRGVPAEVQPMRPPHPGDRRHSATAAPTRDAMVGGPSACAVCLLSEMAERRADYGDVIAAAADYDAFFDEGLSCADEPLRALAHCLLPYLETGQSEKAVAAFSRLYPLIRSTPRHLSLVAQCITFMTVTGDLDHGLGLLRRHMAWLPLDTLDARSRFDALTAMAALLDGLESDGRGDEAVVGAEDPSLIPYFGAHVGSWLVSDLAEACWQTATQIGEAFDGRNGNGYFAALLESARGRAAPPDFERPRLASVTAHATAAPRTTAARSTAASTTAALPIDATPSGDDALTAGQWLALARERATIADDSGARWALRWGHDSLDRQHRQIQQQRESLRARLFALEIQLDVQSDDLEHAQTVLDKRIGALGLDSTEDHGDLIAVETQLGLQLFGAPPGERRGELEQALASVRRLTMSAESQLSVLNALGALRTAQGAPREAADLLLSAVRLCGHAPDDERVRRPLFLLAWAQFDAGDFDGAVIALDRLLRHDLDRAFRASALLLRASAQFERGWLSLGVTDADRALALYFELSHGAGIVDSCSLLASLLEAQGVQTGVVEAWRLASDEADDLDLPDAAVLRYRLARALLAADRGAEAAAALDVVFDSAIRGNASCAELAEIVYWLGHAQRMDDDDDAAYCSWSLGLSYVADTPNSRQSIQLGLALGRLLLDNDEDDSVDVLAETVRQARLLSDSPWELVDALHLLGIAQTTFGFSGGLQALDEAVDVAADHCLDIDALVANITESRARGLDNLGRDDEATEIAFEAAHLYERLGDRGSAGHAHLFAARLLATQGRIDEALPAYERSLELLVDQHVVAQMAETELRALVGRQLDTRADATPLQT